MYENLFPNYSFENIPDFNWTASNFTWATDSNWVASDAVKSFEVFSGGYGAASNISLEANTTYRLTMDMAGNPNGGAVVKQLRVTVTDGGSLNQTFDWQFDTTGKTTSNMGWTQKSAQFSTGASPGPVMIEVREMGSDSFGPVIDNAWLFKL